MNQSFSIQEAIKYGWEVMKKRFWFFAGMFVILYALMYGLPFLGQYLISVFLNENSFAIFTFGLAANVLGVIIGIGVIKISLNVYEDKPVDYAMLFNQWSFFWKYLGGMILYSLIIAGGLILLIVPGIIWAIKYQFVPYLVLEGYSPLDALSRSGAITKGVKWHLFLLGLLTGLISLLGLILLVVGLFAAQPIILMAMVFVYKKLQNSMPKEPVLPELAS